ncbi:hypothetical protein A5761_09895 [Mycolicibacterium setense]|nr:hypothetical protein A5761_09895 [Mycolicibacterium setense]
MIAAACVTLVLVGVNAPTANAVQNMMGNYNLIIPDRYDFHTWIWANSRCPGDSPRPPDCVHVTGIPQPIAKAYNYRGEARLVAGRYTLTVDDPFGLRCDNVYYGPTFPTRDVYSWDGNTLAGTLTSTFDSGCDGQPGTLTYPIWLQRL